MKIKQFLIFFLKMGGKMILFEIFPLDGVMGKGGKSKLLKNLKIEQFFFYRSVPHFLFLNKWAGK